MQGRAWKGYWIPDGMIRRVDCLPAEGENAREFLYFYA